MVASVTTAGGALGLAVGILELVLAVVVGVELSRFGRAFPWLAALLAFFALRGIARIHEAFAGSAPSEIAFALDGLLVLVIVLLIVGLDRTTSALKLARDEAENRERDYERALLDYRRLARHRLANPLTAILGSVIMLQEQESRLPPGDRRRLLELIRSEADRLQHVALDPDPASPEEATLEPRPMVASSRSPVEPSTRRARG